MKRKKITIVGIMLTVMSFALNCTLVAQNQSAQLKSPQLTLTNSNFVSGVIQKKKDISKQELVTQLKTDIITFKPISNSIVKSSKAIAANIQALNKYASGTTMQLNFKFDNFIIDDNGDTLQSDNIDSLAMIFPIGLTPVTGSEIVGNEALNAVTGQTISWGNNNNSSGGIWSGAHSFWVEVTISAGITGDQTVSFYISEDEQGSSPFDATGTFTIQEVETVTDYDGNIYEVVTIGNQTWMAENLKTTSYADGTAIPLVTDNAAWGNLGDNDTDKAYCYYLNSADTAAKYGALYTYAAATNGTPHDGVNNVQGVCPTGWHLPSDADWTELTDTVGINNPGLEGAVLKSLTGWNEGGNGTDDYSFTALPGGDRDYDGGTFDDVGSGGIWWSSTEDGSSYAYYRSLYYGNSSVYRDTTNKSTGFSARCIKDISLFDPLSISNDTIDFGEVIQNSSEVFDSVYLINSGADTLEITGAYIYYGAPFNAGLSGFIIPPNDSITLYAWISTDTLPGFYSDTLYIETDANDTVIVLRAFITEAMETISIIGEFNGWIDDHIMQQDTENPDIFTTYISFTNDDDNTNSDGIIELKFRQNAKWAVNWGSVDFPTGIGTLGGANIPVPIGKYKVTFNYITGEYIFEETGKVIWSEDFDGSFWSSTVDIDGNGYVLSDTATLPEGWTIVDNTDLDYLWHWSDVGPRGAYTQGDDGDPFTPWNEVLNWLPEGTSTENGFMMLESDYFNTTDQGVISANPTNMDAILQYGPIDFSAYPGAVFNVKTIYRYCCSNDAMIGLEVSSNYNPSDGTGDWTNVQLNILTPGNEFTHYAERDFHANVSKFVGGNSAVYFRLHQTQASHYFWIVDDVSFYEAPTNDIILKDGFADYIYDAENPDYHVSSSASHNFWGGYTEIPQFVVGDFIKYRAAVYGNGTSDAVNATLTAKIYKDDNLDATFTSTPKNVYSYSDDTLRISQNYILSGVGQYKIALDVSMDEVDENIADNSWEYNFAVTSGNTYSRVRHGMEQYYDNAGPRDWASGGNDGDACVQRFNFPESVENIKVTGISVYIDDYSNNPDEIAAIVNGEFSVIAHVYTTNEDGDIVDAGIASNLYTLTISDTATWLNLNFVDEGNLILPAGLYWAGIEIYTGNIDYRFLIGNDTGASKQPNTGGLVYLSSQSGWYTTKDNYAIDLIIEPQSTVTLTFNVNMTAQISSGIFDAANEPIYVTGSFNEWSEPGKEGSIVLTDENNDNIYTGAIELSEGVGEIQYKYFINSGWDRGEWEGQPNRSVEVFSNNVIVNDIFSIYEGAPPAIITTYITSTTASSANIQAIVNANNLSTGLVLYYGLSAESLSLTANVDPATISGTTNTTVQIAINGLASDTEYFYQLVATNSLDIVTLSEIKSFTAVEGAAPDIISINTTAITLNSANIEAVVNANNISTGLEFYYGTTSSNLNQSATVVPSTISGSNNETVQVKLANLMSDQVYFYQLIAGNSSGTVQSAIKTFKTTGSSGGDVTINGETELCEGAENNTYFVSAEDGASYSWSVSNGSIKSGQGTDQIIVNWYSGITQGSVSIVLTESNSNVKSGSLSVNLSGSTTIGTPEIHPKGAINILICKTEGMRNYQWFKDGIAISGETGQYMIAENVYGNYYVSISDYSGCWVNSETYTVSGKKNLLIYPNPGNSSTTINYISDLNGEFTVKVIDMYGKTMRSFNWVKDDTQINREISFDGLDKGVYMIEISIDNIKMESQRFIKN